MFFCSDDVRVCVQKVKSIPDIQAEFVYDLEGYSDDEFHDILLIENEGYGLHYKMILYCSSLGNYEYCTAVHEQDLVIAKFNTVYKINIPTGKMEYKVFSDMAGAFQLYVLDDGYLIHGECEVLKLDFQLNTIWSFAGADIFASPTGEKCLEFCKDCIKLKDFSNNCYVIPLTDVKNG